jgi:hypothetical protein
VGIKMPYSAFKRIRVGLSTWAADFGLVGLKYLYVFFKRVAGACDEKKALKISVLGFKSGGS